MKCDILLQKVGYRNTARKPAISDINSKPGALVLCFWDGLGLSDCWGVCSVFATVLPELF
jgi:hypothetical protein